MTTVVRPEPEAVATGSYPGIELASRGLLDLCALSIGTRSLPLPVLTVLVRQVCAGMEPTTPSV